MAYIVMGDITWNASPDTTWTQASREFFSVVGYSLKRVLLRIIVQVKQLLEPQKTIAKVITDKASQKLHRKKTTEKFLQQKILPKIRYPIFINKNTGGF
ncbi:MAG: hypothetical protein ACLTEE_16165 [Anaerobutyricum hallii]